MKLISKIKGTLKKILFFSRIKVYPIGNNVIKATNKKKNVSYYFPYESKAKFDYRQLHNLYYGFDSYLHKKYTEGDIQILPTDTVIDCGAFVGGFTIAAAKANAKKVISIEPSSKNYNCLEKNIEYNKVSNQVEAIKIGLGDQVGIKSLNLSKSGCDDSFLEPDEGDLKMIEKVKVNTLSALIEEYNLDPNHLFLKVEAEGFEPEIIIGLGVYKPRVIVIDITPERNGQSPREQIHSLLKQNGYKKFIQTTRCLFASI